MNAHAAVAPASNQVSPPHVSREYAKVDSLLCAALMAFAGASLDAFLYLNHGHIYAGVMTGNAVLCGVGFFNKSAGGALHYAWPLLAYVCGIWLISMFQHHIRHHPVRYALATVMLGLFIMSVVPASLPEVLYASIVVLLTGFMVGISKKVDSYSYNATVLTGSLRDTTISFYNALNPAFRVAGLRKGRDLGLVMLSFLAGAVCGGLLGRHIGNHALWLPIAVLGLVCGLVIRSGSSKTGFDDGNRESGAKNVDPVSDRHISSVY